MVYVLWTSRTLQDTIDVLKAAKDAIQDTELIKMNERSEGNVLRSFQLAENQVDAAFISLHVRPSLCFMVLLHIDRSLPQGESKISDEAQDPQVCSPPPARNDIMLIPLFASHAEGVYSHRHCC